MSLAIGLQSAPFSDDFIDVTALNAHVSSAIVERIEQIRRSTKTPSRALAILGPAGGGKTHVFARLRQGEGPRATLILLRPYFGINVGPRDVLATIIDQLCLPVRGTELTPLDLLVSHWLADGEGGVFPSASIEQMRSLDGETRARRVDDAVASVISQLPEAAPATHLLRSLLSLDVRDRGHHWAELAWLSGREPRTVDDTTPLGEADVMQMLRLLSTMAAPVAPLVLVFDQLENLASDDDARVRGYGNLIGELIDTVPSLTIVQLALTSEWLQSIEPRLSLPQKTRVASEVLVLESPSRSEREQLLRAWHKRLAANGGRKRFPGPLTAVDLETLLDAPGMTPRLLLAALLRAASGKPAIAVVDETTTPRSEDDRVQAVWTNELARVRVELGSKVESGVPVEIAQLAEGLSEALVSVPSFEVDSRVERERISMSVRSPGHEIVVLFVASLHHASVAGALNRATELAQITKVVIVREKRFELPRTWETVDERRAAFERLPNSRWLWLEQEDAARCLALGRLMSQSRAKRLDDVTKEQLLEIAKPRDWHCVNAITLWLTDVPRGRLERVEPPPKQAPIEPPAPPSVRDWMRMGRSIAKRYVEELRANFGRKPK